MKLIIKNDVAKLNRTILYSIVKKFNLAKIIWPKDCSKKALLDIIIRISIIRNYKTLFRKKNLMQNQKLKHFYMIFHQNLNIILFQ